MNTSTTLTALLLSATFAAPALAHTGRRFEVRVDAGGQLFAQGVNTGAVSDGAPDTRPYINAIHDHWTNSLTGTNAFADLPSFDLFTPPAELVGANLTLTLDDAFKWDNPGMMPATGTVPDFVDLAPSEKISLIYNGNILDTDNLGQSLTLVDNVQLGGHPDLDLSYEIGVVPDNTIYILAFTLGTDAAGVADSESIYAILLPQKQLHHAGLYTERYLGTPVPEPGSRAALAVLGGVVGTRRRRASRR